MKEPPRKYIAIIGTLILTFVVACRLTSPPEFLDKEALQLWGDGDSIISIHTRLGNGVPRALDISPDGKNLAVGSAIGLSTYRYRNLKELWMSPTDEPVEDVNWSPDGKQLAVASGTDVSIWDAKTGEMLETFEGHTRTVNTVVWSTDGTVLVSGSLDQNIIVWKPETGKQVYRLNVADNVKRLAWSPQEDLLAVGLDLEKNILLVDAHTRDEVFLPFNEPYTNSVNDMAWSPDGKRLAVGGITRAVIWDTQTGELLQTYGSTEGISSTVDSVAWSPDSELLATGLDNGTIIVWDVRTNERLFRLSRQQSNDRDDVLDLAWSKDGRYLISTSKFEPITVWDIQTRQAVRSSGGHSSWVLDLVWSPDGSKLATGSEDGEIRIWYPRTGKELKSFYDTDGMVSSLAWSPDGSRLASGAEHTVTVWNAQTGKELQVLMGHDRGVTSVAWSPDGSILASIADDGRAMVWDGSTGEWLGELQENTSIAEDLVWSPGGNLAGFTYYDLVTSKDRITIWDWRNGDVIQKKSDLRKLFWSPINDTLISFTFNHKTIVIWSAMSGDEICRIAGDLSVESIDFSPNGELAVAGHNDGSMVVFNVQTCAQLYSFKAHAGLINKVSWSPRGTWIASSSWDGTFIIWEVEKNNDAIQ